MLKLSISLVVVQLAVALTVLVHFANATISGPDIQTEAFFEVKLPDGYRRIEGNVLKVQLGQNITLRCSGTNLTDSLRIVIGKYTSDGELILPLIDQSRLHQDLEAVMRRTGAIVTRIQIVQLWQLDDSIVRINDAQPYDLAKYVCYVRYGKLVVKPIHNLTLETTASEFIGVRAAKIIDTTNGSPIGYTCSVYRTENTNASLFRMSFCLLELSKSESGKVALRKRSCGGPSTFTNFGKIVVKAPERVSIDRFSLTGLNLTTGASLTGKSVWQANLIRESYELTPFDELTESGNRTVLCSVVEDETNVTYGDYVTVQELPKDVEGIPISQKPGIDVDLDSILICLDEHLVGEPGSFVTFVCGITQPEFSGKVDFKWQILYDENWTALDVDAVEDYVKLETYDSDNQTRSIGKRPWMKFQTRLSVKVSELKTVDWRFRVIAKYSDGSIQTSKEFSLASTKKTDVMTFPTAEQQAVTTLDQDTDATVEQTEVTSQELKYAVANPSDDLKPAALSGASVLTAMRSLPVAMVTFFAAHF